MCISDPADGPVLADRGLAPPRHLHDSHGKVQLYGVVSNSGILDWSSLARTDVHQGCGSQLFELNQLHVLWWLDHGYCCGAL